MRSHPHLFTTFSILPDLVSQSSKASFLRRQPLSFLQWFTDCTSSDLAVFVEARQRNSAEKRWHALNRAYVKVLLQVAALIALDDNGESQV